MMQTQLWKDFESGDNLLRSIVRTLIVVLSAAVLLYAVALELMWPEQAVLGIVTVLIAAVLYNTHTGSALL